MTVESTSYTPDSYSGNGSTTSFTITFDYLDDDHIVVKLIDTSTTPYTVTTLTSGTHYNVTGGSVVTTVGNTPATGETLWIGRTTPQTQGTDFKNLSTFDAEDVEDALDKSVLLLQEREEEVSRALKFASTSGLSDVEIDASTLTANYYLRVNSSGDGFDLVQAVTGSTIATTVTDYAKTWLDDTDAATALGTLGLTATAAEINILDGFDAVNDEDDMSSDSATALTTQQAVKAHVKYYALPKKHKHGLVIKTASTSTVDIDADEIVATGSGDTRVLLEDVDVTVDITGSGANGLDTGSEATSTMYYAWVIYNPTTDTIAGLLSLSDSSPTLPSGYTFKRLVGECYNDSGGDIELFQRDNDRTWFENPQAVYTAQTLTTSFVQHSLPGSVPSGCIELELECNATTNTGNRQVISPDNTTRHEVAIVKPADSTSNNGGTGGYIPTRLTLKHLGATSIYARVNHNDTYANQGLHVWGYKLPR